MRKIVALALSALTAFSVLAVAADASACRRPVNPVVSRPTSDNLIRASQLESQARVIEQQAVTLASRAESTRRAAFALEEAVPASFGEVRDAIVARIDALLERAAIETGQARTLRVRASELRAQAQRLRQNSEGGGGWRGRGVERPTASDAVDI